MSKCITSKINSPKFLFKEEFANPEKFQPSKYSDYMVCSSEECFTSSNNRFINSNNCPRGTKFSAKMTFILFTGDLPQYFFPQITTNPSDSVEKQTFHPVQSLSSSIEKAEI